VSRVPPTAHTHQHPAVLLDNLPRRPADQPGAADIRAASHQHHIVAPVRVVRRGGDSKEQHTAHLFA